MNGWLNPVRLGAVLPGATVLYLNVFIMFNWKPNNLGFREGFFKKCSDLLFSSSSSSKILLIWMAAWKNEQYF